MCISINSQVMGTTHEYTRETGTNDRNTEHLQKFPPSVLQSILAPTTGLIPGAPD